MNSFNTPILEISRPLEMRRMEMLAALVLEALMVMFVARIGADWLSKQVSHFHGVVHDITLA